jgi:hypothetical protein
MNSRTTLLKAVHRIAQPRTITSSQVTFGWGASAFAAYAGNYDDVEVRMTRGLVDDGVPADAQFRVTGGVTT